MNIFLTVNYRNDAPFDIDHIERSLAPYLPKPAVSVQKKSGKKFFVISWEFNNINAINILNSESRITVFDGFIEEDLFFKSDELQNHLSGEYVYSSVGENFLSCGGNLAGSHNLYYLECEEYVATSNRASILAALQGNSTKFDLKSLAWKALIGYQFGEGTIFSNIRRMPTGGGLSLNPEGELSVTGLNWNDIADEQLGNDILKDPVGAFQLETQRLSHYVNNAHRYFEYKPIEIPLSGGKDSRAILAMILRAGIGESIRSIWTRGNLYSPEVLSAKDLCDVIGFDKHETRLSPYVANIKISANLLLNSINLTDGLVSLYDFAGLANNEHFVVQGHQNALRPGMFDDYINLEFPVFIENVVKHKFKDHLNSTKSLKELQDDVRDAFSRWEHLGASIAGELFYITQRNPNWVAAMSQHQYMAGPIVNPLMSGPAIRFALSCPAHYRAAELYHFMTIYFAKRELVSVPFAGQRWTPALLQAVEELGLPIDKSQLLVAPYEFDRAFPNASNPWMPNIKNIYLNVIKAYLIDVIYKDQFLIDDIVDVGRFLNILQTDDITFQQMYRVMGVAAAHFIARFGMSIFHQGERKAVVSVLQAELDTLMGDQQVHSPLEDRALELLRVHEEAIATLVRRIQSMK